MTTAEELERRALVGERLARSLASVEIDSLLRASGPDTWIGPTADELCRLLRVTRAELAAATSDARAAARRLHLEARAALARELSGPGL